MKGEANGRDREEGGRGSERGGAQKKKRDLEVMSETLTHADINQ